jgi:hypothetical protein
MTRPPGARQGPAKLDNPLGQICETDRVILD